MRSSHHTTANLVQQFATEPVAIDRRFGFIRESMVTSASQADGRMLPRLGDCQDFRVRAAG